MGKTSWIAIILGSFVIVLVGLGLVSLQQIQEKARLNNELTQSRAELDGIQLEPLSEQQADLENQLIQATAEFETSREILSKPMETVSIIKSVYDIADNSEVEVTQVNSSVTSEQSEGINCSTRTISAKISGDPANLVSFITILNGRLPTGVINSMTVTTPLASSNQTASADITLVVYVYNGG